MLSKKSRMQIRAKEINTHQNVATLLLLAFCVIVIFLLSNVGLLINLAYTQFRSISFLSNNYFKLVASALCFLASIPVLAKLKTIREVWFILKTKSVENVSYLIVRNAVKQVGLFRYVNLYVQIWTRQLIWFVLLVSPTFFMAYFWVNLVIEANATTIVTFLMAIGTLLLLINSLTAFSCLKQKYALCYWLIIQRKDLNVNQVIKESARFMDKKAIDFFIYKMRFVAWVLLCLVFIPAVTYVYPYYKHANAVYCFEILSHKNKFKDKTVTFERIK